MNYSKINTIYRLQKWMDGSTGQTFLNYAYSWGASVVVLGTLFKLTHMPSANFWLFLGMGTEVFVFFISAFDRPFNKMTDGTIPVEQKEASQAPQAHNTKSPKPSKEQVSMSDSTQKVLEELNEYYTNQLEKAKKQALAAGNIDLQLNSIAEQLMELNGIYRRMVKAASHKD